MNAVKHSDSFVGLGTDLVREFLPHRPPFLFVDIIDRFSTTGGPPFLAASHCISPNEPVFAGHFPDRYLWPGVFTIEGLSQSCLLLRMLIEVEEQYNEKYPAGSLPSALRAWQQNVTRLGGAPPPPDPRVEPLSNRSKSGTVSGYRGGGGLLVAADIKLVHPVWAGQRLEYHVQRTHVVGPMFRYNVEAAVAGRSVARGTLTLAMAPAEANGENGHP
jgi:3-hydroxyacyl-[acyl-carrier-protein] dehydratase